MTIDLTDKPPRISYTVGQGVTTTSFDTDFEFFDATDLKVVVDGTTKTITEHYTVSGGNGSTGTVTMSVTGATGGSTVIIYREIPLSRTTDFPASGAFPIATLNTELDRTVALFDDRKDRIDRSIRLLDTDDAATMTLPAKANRVGTVLGFNATTGAVEAGPTIANVSSLSSITSNINTLGPIAADITTLAHIQDGTSATNAITKVSAIQSHVTTVAGIDSNVTTVAGKASLITSDFAADMALVTADFVADVNTLATSNIVDDLNILATSDIVDDMALLATSDNVTAMGKLGDDTVIQHMANLNASNVITNIGTVATNTENVNKFANRYRIESSAPTSSLDAGDLYFNTTTNRLSYYDGSAWKLTGESAERTITTHTVTSAGTQTISVSYTVGLVDVYLNGVKLSISSGDATASKGSSVVVTNAAINDIIEIVALSPLDVATLGTASSKNVGIANNNIPIFTSGVADNDYLKVDGTTIEGRDASQVLSDIGAAALAGATFTGGIKEQSTAGALSNSNQTLTLDLSLSNNFTLTTAAAISNFVVNNHTDGQASIFTLRVTYSNSAHDITWTNTSTSVSVKWSGGTAPTQSDSGTDLYVFFADASSNNVPTTIYGFTAGQAMA